MRRLFCCILGLICLSSGCSMLEWVRPHQLYKLNRQPSMARDDAYFSIPASPVTEQKTADANTHFVKPF
ncbi:hypothetical protein N9153_02950 [Planctomicrobium sp.]|jgi:hypothetical protein|nr:hypothetical protein [Planctomicrobium sp.]MDB4439863.1 hypothetical protein [Planctomicrobium sp.]